jgi:hypothetical protein
VTDALTIIADTLREAPECSFDTLAGIIVAALSAGGLKIAAREPTEAIREAYRKYYGGKVEGDAWVVGWDAAAPSTDSRSQQVREER